MLRNSFRMWAMLAGLGCADEGLMTGETSEPSKTSRATTYISETFDYRAYIGGIVVKSL